MTTPEFSRLVRLDTLSTEPRSIDVAADADERTALARRFGLIAIHRLEAKVELSRRHDDVIAHGRLVAEVEQKCVASNVPVPESVDVPFDLVFRPHPEATGPDEEVELDEGDMDVVFYAGGQVDVGEAAGETLALNLDPFPRSPEAETALKAAGVKSEEEAGPFGALAGLKEQLEKKKPR